MIVVTKIKVEKVKVPNEMLEIKAIPKVPKDIKMQSDVANYTIDLLENDIECHSKIDTIRKFLKGK